MILNNSTFKKLISETPSIEAVLEWDDLEGNTELKDYETETPSFYIKTSLKVSESGTIDSGDYHTPPSFNSNGIEVSDVHFTVFCKNTDSEIHFTEEQTKAFTKDIITNLQTTS